MKIAVWIARILLGATFLLSGVTKMVDPYGVQIKIDAYLAAWHMLEVIPAGLVLVGGCALAMLEFIVGLLLFTGSLRRSAAYCATAIMCFMLPLTVYIALKNPVDDCGCFGDFLILSNWATMFKNIVLMALALFLCKYNRRARWLFAPWIQWVEMAAGVVYMLILGIIGYHTQPLLDFRAYPVGEPLSGDAEVIYTYQRNGEIHEFPEDALPDEADGWEYVDVKPVKDSRKLLALIDRFSGDDVTEEVIGATPEQMLLLIPDPHEAGAAGSYAVNELHQAMDSRFGPGAFVAVTAADSVAVERAMDLMMAAYPVYYADAKAISAVARGNMAVVYLKDGIVVWKRVLNSVMPHKFTPESDFSEVYDLNGSLAFLVITLFYIAANILILLIGYVPAWFRLKASSKRA